MKAKLLYAFLLGGFLTAQAQFTVKDDNGNIINDGDIIEYGSLDQSLSELQFFVTNDNTSEPIFSRIEYVSKTNGTTSVFEELCYEVECFFAVPVGTFIPPAHYEAIEIAPGRTTGIGNHFYDNDPGNGGNVDSVFTFRQFDGLTGTNSSGHTLTFTYRYNPLLSVNGNTKVNLSLHTTLVSDYLTIDVNEPVQMTVYDLQGRLVKHGNLQIGQQVVNVSDLSSNVYVVQFKNEGGATKTSKVIIR